eukprot:scaffold7410_cov169-Ochromonas_danica.AAC.5
MGKRSSSECGGGLSGKEQKKTRKEDDEEDCHEQEQDQEEMVSFVPEDFVHPAYAPNAAWKHGVMPYEIVFARKLFSNYCSSRHNVRVECYYPARPLTAPQVKGTVG